MLQRWRSERSFVSTGLRDADVAGAFLQGSLGPDMGYFHPAAHRLSTLAHRSRPADFARALIECAASSRQRAYAWGWTTHLLADAAVHPLINRATAELVDSSTAGTALPADHPASHLRIELGLDAYITSRARSLRLGSLDAGIDPGELDFVVAAAQRTYGGATRLEDLARGHAAIRRLVPLLLALGRVCSWGESALRESGRRRSGHVRPRAAVASDREGKLSIAAAFVRPVTPRPWLVREVRRRTRGFAEEFLALAYGAFRDLPNVSLDTGEPIPEAGPVRWHTAASDPRPPRLSPVPGEG